MRIRLGVVGLGDGWERRYKPALLRMSDKFEVRAIYDEVSYRGRVQATELECDAADGYTCLIERDDIDAVYVLGSSWLGLEPVHAACRAGKAVFLGRPIGINTPSADEAISALQSSGVRFMVEFPWRFYPATIRLMELLASGLGAPQLVFCDQHVLDAGKTGWSPPGCEGGANEMLLHIADWFRFVFSQDPSQFELVGGCVSEGPSRGFETLTARFGDQGIGQATVVRFLQSQWAEAAQFGRSTSIRVVAEHGMAFLDMPAAITWFDRSGRHEESLDQDRPLAEMLNDRFYRIFRHGLSPAPGLEDAIWARRMIQEARRGPADNLRFSTAQRTAG